MKTCTLTTLLALTIATPAHLLADDKAKPDLGQHQHAAAWQELSTAIAAGKLRQVKRLTDKPGSAQLHSADPWRRSLLHLAVASTVDRPKKSQRILDHLLAAGAEPNKTMLSGFSPLHEAARVGSLEAARKLVAAGANLNGVVDVSHCLDPHYDFDDCTPIEIARQLGHDKLSAFLYEASIAWGKPVDGLQLGIAVAPGVAKDHPPYVDTFIRNTGDGEITFLPSVQNCLALDPDTASLFATEIHLFHRVLETHQTLFYHGPNHLHLLDENVPDDQPGKRTLYQQPGKTAAIELSDSDAAIRSITLAPGERANAAPLFHLGSDWRPHRAIISNAPLGHYDLSVTLKIDHPKSPWKGTLKSAPTHAHFPQP